MIRTAFLGLALASAGALPALAPLADELRFAPEVGSAVAKTFTSTVEFELDDLTLIVDGEDVLGTFGMPSIRFEIGSRTRIVDRYLAVDAGRPTRLERHFDGVSMMVDFTGEMAGESESTRTEVGSAIDGKRVVFTWNERDQDFDVAWAPDNNGGQDLLDGLKEDMDLRSLLPAGSAKIGDTWNIPVAALTSLWMPGGDLGFESDEGEEEMQAMMAGITEKITRAFEEQLRGARTATFSEVREIGGRRIGVIDLDIEMQLDFDMSGLIREMLTKLPDEVSLTISLARIRYSGNLGGEALWDIAAGVAHGLELGGDIEAEIDIRASVSAMGEERSFEVSAVVTGAQKLGLTTALQ